jgi:hypothetical protein
MVCPVARRRGCKNQGTGALFVTDAEDFLADQRLEHEVFGSSSLVVRCENIDSMAALSEKLEGQLTRHCIWNLRMLELLDG